MLKPLILCLWIAMALAACSITSNTNIPLATCSDAVAAIRIATALKAGGKLNLAQERTIEAAMAKLQPVCESTTPQTVLSAVETAALNNITSITGSIK